jgi:hypothetical protein
MTATILIFKPNGDLLKTIVNPITWSIDEKGMLTVGQGQVGPNNILRTTLPFSIESPS